jgi:hypothetical protein
MEDGGWRMEDGGWRMEDGGWRMEDGGWSKHNYNFVSKVIIFRKMTFYLRIFIIYN